MTFKKFFFETVEKHIFDIKNVFVRGSRVSGIVMATSVNSAIAKLVFRHLDSNQKNNPGPHIAKAKALRGYIVKDLGVHHTPAGVTNAWWQESVEGALKHIPGPNEKLPEEVNKAFDDLANNQRGDPESAMMDATMFHSGVWAFALEHVGDLTHRMAQDPNFYRGGKEYVSEKVRRVLRYLTQEYGFKREFEENIQNNYRSNPRGLTYKQYMSKLYELGRKYAAEHKKLVVYNEAQWRAQQAAVNIGLTQFNDTTIYLWEIKKMLESNWEQHALTYYTVNNKLVPYTLGLEYSPLAAKI